MDAFLLLFPLNSRLDCKGVEEGAVDMAGASLERQDIPAPALKSAAEPEGPSSSFPNAWELGLFLPLTCLGSVYRTPAAPQKHALFFVLGSGHHHIRIEVETGDQREALEAAFLRPCFSDSDGSFLTNRYGSTDAVQYGVQ